MNKIKIFYFVTILFFLFSCAGGSNVASNNTNNTNNTNNSNNTNNTNNSNNTNNNNHDVIDDTDDDTTDITDVTDTTDITDTEDDITDITDVTDTTDITDTEDAGDTTDTDGGTGTTSVILSEVFYNPSGTDNQLEWVELYNNGDTTVDLSNWSLGYGGTTYIYGTYQLSGTLSPGDCVVVGGSLAGVNNGNPTYFQSQDFDPDIQNSGSTADGLALFNVTASLLTSSTIPVDAVIYGTTNTSNLMDSTGAPGSVNVPNAVDDSSIRRTSLTTWETSSVLTPGDCSHIVLSK